MVRFSVLATAAAVLALETGTTVRSQADEDPRREYEIVLPAEVESLPETAETVSLTIAARSGYSISQDGPLVVKLTIAPEDGVKLPKRQYTREDAADARAANPRFDLRYRTAKVGEYRLTVGVRFWVCTRRTCRPVRETREVAIRVAAPAPSNDAGVGADGGGT